MPRKVSQDEYLSKRQPYVGKTSSGTEAVFKGLSAPASYDPAKRSADFVMSSESIDRMGDIVRQDGLDITRFLANPQGLLFHDSRNFPIGLWENVKKKQRPAPKRTEGTFKFAPALGPIPQVDQAAWAVEHGLMRTVSIGFMPKDLEAIDHDDATQAEVGWSWGFDIKTSELLECPLVPIPAQADAIAKGLIEQDEMPAAREFVERALDEWARDPRTGMLIPRKELETIYARYFGSDGPVIMALDFGKSAQDSVIGQIDKALKEKAPFAFDGDRLVIPNLKVHRLVSAKAVAGGGGTDAGVSSNSGTQIIITVEQPGGTGANTRVGEGNGDASGESGQAAAAGGEQREVPKGAVGVRRPLAGRIAAATAHVARMLGHRPATPTRHVPGSLSKAKDALRAHEERLAS